MFHTSCKFTKYENFHRNICKHFYFDLSIFRLPTSNNAKYRFTKMCHKSLTFLLLLLLFLSSFLCLCYLCKDLAYYPMDLNAIVKLLVEEVHRPCRLFRVAHVLCQLRLLLRAAHQANLSCKQSVWEVIGLLPVGSYKKL